jgi:hypothetical protein
VTGEAQSGPPPPPPAEFGRRLLDQARSPGFVLVAGTALIATFVLFLVALLMSLLPHNSLLGNTAPAPVIRFALARVCEMSLVPFTAPRYGLELRTQPAAELILTLLALAIPAALLARRTRGASPRTRLLQGAAVGPAFGVCLVVCGLAAGTIGSGTPGEGVHIDAGAAFGLGLLWGALAGLGAVAFTLRREGVPLPAAPPRVAVARRLVWAALRPLLLALAVAAVVGTVVWAVQSIRDAGDQRRLTRSTRALATTIVDDVAYVADNGVHLFELGSGVGFHQPGIFRANGLPLPATKVDEIAGHFDFADVTSPRQVLEPPGSFRIFDYASGLPAVEFVVLLLLMPACALVAAYAGYSVARAAGAARPERGAAWGALTGPVWAVTMVVVNALVQKQFGSKAVGDQVLAVYLLGGGVLGALGGLLAVGGRAPGPRPAPPPPPAGEPARPPERLWSD